MLYRQCLILDEGSRYTVHSAVHLHKQVSRHMDTYGNYLWKLGCHNGSVSRGNGLISTTGSKVNVTGAERTHTLTHSFSLSEHFTLPLYRIWRHAGHFLFIYLFIY